MLELIQSGGLLMIPILLCSAISLAICAERLWTLRTSKITPPGLLNATWKQMKAGRLDQAALKQLHANSPLGRILAAGILNARHGREVMKEAIEDAAAQVIHEMERYLSTLGSIAAISPLLGLLGTVIGMIKVFADIMLHGTGDAALLAGGISQALITTAAGLTVAIPSVFFHRFFVRRIDELAVAMERDAIRLVEVVQGEREATSEENL